MLRLLGYLCALAGFLYVAIIYNNEAMVFVVFAGLVLLFLAYLYLVYVYTHITCNLQMPIHMTEQKKPVNLEIKVENRGLLPVAKMRFVIAYKVPLSRERGKFTMDGMVDAKQSVQIQKQIVGVHGGGYQFVLKSIKLYDLTGIFCLRKKRKERVQLNVMPAMQELPVIVTEASRNFQGEADVYDDTIGGDDVSEVFQIRAFRDGDKLQSIHWKMTAKTDELMVRENSLPLGCPVVLFVETMAMRQKAEMFLQLLASMSYSLVIHRCNHFITWYSEREKDVIRVRVDGEEGLYLALLMLFLEPGSKKEQDIKMLYQEKYKSDDWVTDIYVNQYLSKKIEEVELVV